jgi:hypothetical protein
MDARSSPDAKSGAIIFRLGRAEDTGLLIRAGKRPFWTSLNLRMSGRVLRRHNRPSAAIAMTTRTPPSFWRLALVWAAAHAVLTALFWMGPLTYGALGLGFQDRSSWTGLDAAIAQWALPVAHTLTTPGRFLTYEGFWGLVLPAVLTSATWGVGIAALVLVLRQWRGSVMR